MSDVTPISRPQGALAVPPKRAGKAAETTPSSARTSDKVEFSQISQYLSKLQNLPVRQDLVDHVKGQIASGTYETPEKIDAAAQEIMDDLK